jgi:hypothetical protein
MLGPPSSSAVAVALQAPSSVLKMDFLSPTASITTAAAYMVCANAVYLARRSHLRKMSMKRLWSIRTTREEGVSRPLFCVMLCVWQAFVAVFPVAESLAKLGGRSSFFYTYPKASGCGIILEPLNVQHLESSKRAKEQIRLDWHRFSHNVGNVGRDGYRHPPSVTGNLPHIDIPRKKMKHWPWRRKEAWDGNQHWGNKL